VLGGDGSLFWNGGMRLAYADAMRSDFDYYLWLNGDTSQVGYCAVGQELTLTRLRPDAFAA
jgi:hypothetical protein